MIYADVQTVPTTYGIFEGVVLLEPFESFLPHVGADLSNGVAHLPKIYYTGKVEISGNSHVI